MLIESFPLYFRSRSNRYANSFRTSRMALAGVAKFEVSDGAKSL